MANNDFSIRKKIIIPIVISILAIAIAFIVLATYVERGKNFSDLEKTRNSVEAVLANEILSSETKMELLAARIQEVGEIGEAFQKKDRTNLYHVVLPIFQELKWKFGITNLYFHNTDGTNFFRANSPERYNDTVNRATLAEAIKTGKQTSGVEIGLLGDIALRVVVPFEYGGKLVGFLELGRDIESIISNVSSTTNYDMAIFAHKSLIDKKSYIYAMKSLGHNPNWDDYKTSVLISNPATISDQRIVKIPELVTALEKHPEQSNHQMYAEHSLGDKYFQFTFFPIVGTGGVTLGEVAIFSDISTRRAQQNISIITFSSILFIVGATLIAAFWNILGRVEKTVEQKQAEIINAQNDRQNDLIKNERLVTGIFNSISDIFFAVDKNWILTYVNPRAKEVFEIEVKKDNNKTIWDAVPELASTFYRPLTKAMSSGEVVHIQGPYPPLSNWFDVRAFPTYDGLAVYLLDITERINIENELKKLNEKLEARVEERTLEVLERESDLRAVLQTAADGIITITEKGKVISLNPAAEKIFGYTADEVIGNNIKMLMPQQIANQHDGYLKAYLETGVAKIIGHGREVEGRRKDGTTFPLDLAVSDTQTQSGTQFTGIVRDITERKMAEYNLHAAKAQAEQANQAKSDFLSAMSHDLRTPMNAILGFAQLMETDPSAPLSDDQQESIRQIINAGQHLLSLINEVLDLAKIESGKLTLSMEVVELGPLLTHCCELISASATKRGISVSLDIIDEKCGYVYADHMRLKQVLINILSNAVKYNKQNGKIHIVCKAEKSSMIRISISDTGIGMSDEDLTHIFEPFNRLGADQTEVEGTGIGMTITKDLVELMNGEIHIESNKGQGSTFHVSLQSGGNVEIELSPDDILTVNSIGSNKFEDKNNKKSVLYIEDNPANLRLVEKLLSRYPGIELYSAKSPFLGLEIAENIRPDVILMDINMPGMDGFQLLEKIRNIEEIKHIPVIAISANAMDGDIKKGLAAGFIEYLTKPINIKQLMESLERNLGIK